MATAYTNSRISSKQRRAITSGAPAYDPYAYERERLDREAAMSASNKQLALSKTSLAQNASQYEKSLAQNSTQYQQNLALQQAQFAEQQKQNEINQKNQEEAQKRSDSASTMSGIGTVGQGLMYANYLTDGGVKRAIGSGYNMAKEALGYPTASSASATPTVTGSANTYMPSQAPFTASPGLETTAPTAYTPEATISYQTPGEFYGNIQPASLEVPVAYGAAETGGAIGSTAAGGTFGAASTPVTQSVASSIPGATGYAPFSSAYSAGNAAAAGTQSSMAAATPAMETAGTASTSGTLAGAGSFGMGALSAAGAGYAAPQLLNAIHDDTTREIGRWGSLGLIKDKEAATAAGNIASGAAAGAAIGTWVFPVLGTAVGGFLGAMGGMISTAFGAEQEPTSHDIWSDGGKERYIEYMSSKGLPTTTRPSGQSHTDWWSGGAGMEEPFNLEKLTGDEIRARSYSLNGSVTESMEKRAQMADRVHAGELVRVVRQTGLDAVSGMPTSQAYYVTPEEAQRMNQPQQSQPAYDPTGGYFG